MKEKIVDANKRATRTLWQGLAVAVLLAATGVVLEVVSSWTPDDVLDGEAWLVLTLSIVQAVMTAGASWVQRTWERRE